MSVERGGADEVLQAPEVTVKDDNVYFVEKIVDRKAHEDGELLYLIKWVGYSSKENTWEPAANFVDYPQLIDDFERRLCARLEGKLKRKGKRASEQPPPSGLEPPRKKGAAWRREIAAEEIRRTTCKAGKGRGLHSKKIATSRTEMDPEATATEVARDLAPEKIMGRVDIGGEPCFIMKWEGPQAIDMLPIEEAKQKYPQVVIAFYEERFLWGMRRPLREMLAAGDEGESGSVLGEESMGSEVEGGSGRDPSEIIKWMKQCNEKGVGDSEMGYPDPEAAGIGDIKVEGGGQIN